MDIEWLSLAKGGENFEVTNSDARVLYEGTHPEHGEVEFEIVHNYDGISYELRDADSGNELESGWMTVTDLINSTSSLQVEA
jgi:hypothetical protein